MRYAAVRRIPALVGFLNCGLPTSATDPLDLENLPYPERKTVTGSPCLNDIFDRAQYRNHEGLDDVQGALGLSLPRVRVGASRFCD
ncbi:uncharacterized protein EDB91DRAFT_698018 [Suillus paluster]|uniref:uncharacterized protein n=1 Tax=Suillus paluster TaxID=48578 RepID=UPI001B85E3D5|nr:uncharacterized protein EDB91DRAFT_698018 [Suillus paluster]KAG1750603.1 hypothetical protein EDB91DRAFT_698018 [Suillus paluster]